MAKPVTADVLSKQIKALQNQLFNAKAHFEIYMGLGESWERHFAEIQNSPIFWQFTMKAHIDTAVLHLCKAYDVDGAALQFNRFLDAVERNPSLFCESEFRKRHKARPNVDCLAKYPRTLCLKSFQIDREFCSKSNPLIENLLRWRNHLVAHFNYKEAVVIEAPMHKRHPLLFEHIKALIDGGLLILNRYSSLLDATEYSNQFPSQQGSDYIHILKELRFARIGHKWNGRRIRLNIRRKLKEGKSP